MNMFLKNNRDSIIILLVLIVSFAGFKYVPIIVEKLQVEESTAPDVIIPEMSFEDVDKKDYFEYSKWYRDEADRVVNNLTVDGERIYDIKLSFKIEPEDTEYTGGYEMKDGQTLSYKCIFPEDKSIPPINGECELFINSKKFGYAVARVAFEDFEVLICASVFEDEDLDYSIIVLGEQITNSREEYYFYLITESSAERFSYNYEEKEEESWIGVLEHRLYIDKKTDKPIYVSTYGDPYFNCDCKLYRLWNIDFESRGLKIIETVWEDKGII